MNIEIPGYREAVERENSVRDAAFLDLPEFICGTQVNQITPQHFLILDGIGSPFVSGGTPTAEDVVKFLWILSPEFCRPTSIWNRIRRWRFTVSCRNIDFFKAIGAIVRFIRETFHDSPGGTGPRSAPIASCVAGPVHVLANKYGWSEAEILNLPYKRIFQYFRLIQIQANPKVITFNSSDHVRAKWLDEINAANQRTREYFAELSKPLRPDYWENS